MMRFSFNQSVKLDVFRVQGWRSGESTRLQPPGSLVFPPQQKAVSSGCKSCAPKLHMDRLAAARGAFVCFRFDLVKLPRCCNLRLRFAVTTRTFKIYFSVEFSAEVKI